MDARHTHLSTRFGVALSLVLAPGCDREEPFAPAAAPTPRSSAVVVPDRAGLALATPRELTTRDGLYRVTWSPRGGFVPINEPFELDVTVARNDDARTRVTGATVEVDCQMPDHGHGMLRQPKATEVGDGAYHVRGMLLHMGGHWTVAVTVLVAGVASTADDTLDL